MANLILYIHQNAIVCSPAPAAAASPGTFPILHGKIINGWR
jgi:hypothetical protein